MGLPGLGGPGRCGPASSPTLLPSFQKRQLAAGKLPTADLWRRCELIRDLHEGDMRFLTSPQEPRFGPQVLESPWP